MKTIAYKLSPFINVYYIITMNYKHIQHVSKHNASVCMLINMHNIYCKWDSVNRLDSVRYLSLKSCLSNTYIFVRLVLTVIETDSTRQIQYFLYPVLVQQSDQHFTGPTDFIWFDFIRHLHKKKYNI